MENKNIKKKITGRKPLAPEKKRKPLKVFLNDQEQRQLQRRISQSNATLSQYIRTTLLDDAKKPSHTNPVDFFNNISSLAKEVNKLGVNINQLSKYANQLIINDRIEPHIVETFNEQLEAYAILQNNIEKRLKEILFT